eukprot:6443648-Alexandrium_andersonii.AAC.1
MHAAARTLLTLSHRSRASARGCGGGLSPNCERLCANALTWIMRRCCTRGPKPAERTSKSKLTCRGDAALI